MKGATATWDVGAEVIRLYIPYDKKLLTSIRAIPSRKFHKKPSPHWSIAKTPETVKELKALGFSLCPSLQGIKDKQYPPIKKILKRLTFKGVPHKPKDFQKYGVAFLESRKGRALLADQMRVGKSVQSILWLLQHPEKRPVLIICPSTIKETWKREILKWKPGSDIHIINNRYKKQTLPDADFYIINYDIIAVKKKKKRKEIIRFRKDILQKYIEVLIIDECHKLAYITSQRTKAVRQLRKVPCIIPLSGTPIKDKPLQFFPILNLIAPDIFPSFREYAERYCDPKPGKNGKRDYSGASNIKELHSILKSTIMLRRTRKQVLPLLAEIKPVVVPLPLSDPQNYIQAERGAVKKLNYIFGEEEWKINTKSKNVLEKLKQIVIAEKLEAAIAWIKDVLEQEDKIILFTSHQKTVDILKEELKEYHPIIIDGRTPDKKRQPLVDTFTIKKKHRLLIGNTLAIGEGLDLSVADITVTIELNWTPTDHDQANDRIIHIDKKSTNMFAYFLIAENTIEETIIRILDRKRKVVKRIMDGEEVEETKLLMELLNNLREKYNE